MVPGGWNSRVAWRGAVACPALLGIKGKSDLLWGKSGDTFAERGLLPSTEINHIPCGTVQETEIREKLGAFAPALEQ